MDRDALQYVIKRLLQADVERDLILHLSPSLKRFLGAQTEDEVVAYVVELLDGGLDSGE